MRARTSKFATDSCEDKTSAGSQASKDRLGSVSFSWVKPTTQSVMPRTSLLARLLLPSESVRLGRYVLNPLEPHEDFLDPECSPNARPMKLSMTEYTAVQGQSKDSELGASIGALLDSSNLHSKFRMRATETATSEIHVLPNSRIWFKATLEHEPNREWLEEAVESGAKVYLIVGYQMVLDAQISDQVGRHQRNNNSAQVPVVEAATAALGGVSISGDMINPGFRANFGTTDSFGSTFTAPGIQVCAVQYRMVKFKWWSSCNVDRATLEKGSRWLVHGQLRGQEGGLNDVMEAYISESDEETGQTDGDLEA